MNEVRAYAKSLFGTVCKGMNRLYEIYKDEKMNIMFLAGYEAAINDLKDLTNLQTTEETIAIKSDNGNYFCDACGGFLTEGQIRCGYCKRIIDWNK